jgi:hypothetical protein
VYPYYFHGEKSGVKKKKIQALSAYFFSSPFCSGIGATLRQKKIKFIAFNVFSNFSTHLASAASNSS